MKYKNNPSFSHAQNDRIGVLITNLGTPEAPTSKALRPYLKQFLSDPRVVEIPRVLWWLILNGVILRIRPARSAKSYQSVWTDEGSPLATITKAQHQALSNELKKRLDEKVDGSLKADDIVVNWAMRYGNPSVSSALQNFADNGVRKLVVLPLYPQYSASTTASTFDAIAEDFTQRRWIPELRFVSGYHDDPRYIKALAQSVTEHWKTHARTDKLLFSFHGVPQRYLHNGDPYHCQCLATARLVAEHLGLSDTEYLTTFQSRFGREEWLRPYTDETLKSLPDKGVSSITVICPGFSADCLETIEEIEIENKEYFIEAGGKEFQYIPALNSSPIHIDMIADMVEEQMGNWTVRSNNQDRNERFLQCPHNKKAHSKD